MVLNCNSSKTGNATVIGEDQANAITFRASLKSAIAKTIKDIEKDKAKLKGEKLKEAARQGAIIGVGVLIGSSLFIGCVIIGFASNPVGAVILAVGLVVAIFAICIGVSIGVDSFDIRKELKEYDSQIARLQGLSEKVDSLSAEACANAIAKLKEMDETGNDGCALDALAILEKEIGSFGLPDEKRVSLMKETWESYKAELAKQSKTNIS